MKSAQPNPFCFGQGFRFPSIAEKFIQTSVGAIAIYPNPEIKEETSNAFELGIKQGFKLGAVVGFIDVAAFHQRYQNFVEFTFGQWVQNPTLENNLGLGFRSVNIGNSSVSGLELSFSGQAKWEKASVTFFGGYTYSSPRIKNADEVYATSPSEGTFSLPFYAELNYENSSSDKSGVLKYRLEHMLRSDVQFDLNKWAIGASFRFNSSIKNIDQIFLDLDDPDFFPNLPTGITKWQEEHQKGDGIVDARLLCSVSNQWRIGLIADNLLNREYAIRALAIEPGRVLSFQLTFTH